MKSPLRPIGMPLPSGGPHLSVKTAESGFTLLEVLLTMLLASVVLVTLWSLSDIYLKLFVSGNRKIEETQLIRGLTQRIADDISHVIQRPDHDSPSIPIDRPPSFATLPDVSKSVRPIPLLPATINGANSSSTSPSERILGPKQPASSTETSVSLGGPRQSQSSLPKFGLFGTNTALRLIVLQVDPVAMRESAEFSEALLQPGQARAPGAPELRMIEYSFLSSRESSASDQEAPSGLIRREWAWETWVGFKMSKLQPSESTGSAEMMPEERIEWTPEDALALESDKNLLNVPQITGLEFFYYDGESWDIEWNSWERGRLPSLVEVLIRIKINRDENGRESDKDEIDESDESSEESLSDATERSSSSGTVYRRLVHLPFSETSPAASSIGGETPLAGLVRPSLTGAVRP